MSVPKLLVLPTESSPESRILTLANPRTSKPCRYWFDPSQGTFEFTRIAAPKAACRSWLLKRQPNQQYDLHGKKRDDNSAGVDQPDPNHSHVNSNPPNRDDGLKERSTTTPQDYISKDAELLIATPIDPLFLILPSLINRKLFLSADDLLDSISEDSKHFSLILSIPQIRIQIEARLKAICDTVEAGDEHMYRLNEAKLFSELISKAERIVARGLPASVEEHFVGRVLELPLSVVKREESCSSRNEMHTPRSEETMAESSVESQASTVTVDSTFSLTSAGTEITIPEDSEPDDTKTLQHLRLRTAFSYILSSYLPTSLSTTLTALAASESNRVDFRPLDKRLAEIEKLKAEALAARSVGDFSRKRNMYEEDDLAEGRMEKKKRMEEEEKKKKAAETRGVRDLKKVNTKGMKKMSDFFGKRTSPRKKG